jgi:peptidoglycan L-alanyl-D-glutamate endopeptidase CwlK
MRTMWRTAIMMLALAATPVLAADDGVDQAAAKAALIATYPGLFTIADNTLTWADGTTMVWDDGKTKSAEELLAHADIEDMFHYVYPGAAQGALIPATDFDPGRVRNEVFFERLYGDSAKAVAKHVVSIKWLPKLKGGTVQVTTVFGIDGLVGRVSDELQASPELGKYGLKPGGGFNWRFIAGTTQLSEHSFGIALDVNVGYSNYWRWAKPVKGTIPYKNRIPLGLAALFERQGFIWGGRWYHYDTMHFEYRPELLAYAKAKG